MINHNTVTKISQADISKPIKFASFTKCNRFIDVVKTTWKPRCFIRKISKNEYADIRTGEVKNIMPKVNGVHMRSRRSLRIIFNDLRQLISTNFDGLSNEAFITLTYGKQTKDPAQVYRDLEIFNKRFKRKIKNLGYIHIVEPHASGCWHIHSLYKRMDGQPLDVSYEDVYALWDEKGWVTVEKLKCVDSIGSYFMAYFTNMEIDDEDLHKYPGDIKELPRADGKGTKKVIKGARLDFYPDYMKIYRNSRNLKQPEAVDSVPDDYAKTHDVAYKITSSDPCGDKEFFIAKEQHTRKW
jgi:hypothetical protein